MKYKEQLEQELKQVESQFVKHDNDIQVTNSEQS